MGIWGKYGRRRRRRHGGALGWTAAAAIVALAALLWYTEEHPGEANYFHTAVERLEDFLGDTSAPTAPPGKTPQLSMHVLDVGQGLALLFESEGQYLLYDGGDREYLSKVVGYLFGQGVDTLDYVVASHYDSDHLNGVVGAMKAFDVSEVIAPDYKTDSQVYQSFEQVVRREGLSVEHPEVGTQYSFGKASFTVLAPQDEVYEDENDYSVALRFDCGENSLLVTGDATAYSEQEMMAGGQDTDCDILVAGHHGSAGSSSREFLESVSPQAAVISCEEDNPYGHPARSVMKRLRSEGIDVFRTDRQGDFVISSDGNSWFYSQAPCNDYSGGTPQDSQ